MNKYSIILICLSFLLFKSTLDAQTVTNFFISTTGSDKNQGTIEKPFATAEKAVESIRKCRQTQSKELFNVFFRGGTYNLQSTLMLSTEISGTKSAPIVFRNYENEKVVLHGGERIDGHHFSHCRDKQILYRLLPDVRDKIWVIDLRKEGIADFGIMKQHGFGKAPEPAPLELFINGQPQTLARYPNEGILQIGKVFDKGSVPRNGDFSNRGAEFGYEYERPDRWAKADEIWLHGKFSAGYNDDNLKVERIDEAKRSIKVVQSHLYGVSSSIYDDNFNKLKEPKKVSFRGYYAYSLLEEIDQPGEYYLDRKTGKLYIYPATDLVSANIEVSLKESPFFSFKDASFIRIEGITFTCSRGLGIYEENCHDIVIDHCSFSNLGTVAVSMGQSYKDNTQSYNTDGSPNVEKIAEGIFESNVIRNCLIYNTGTGGVLITGGDRKTLSKGNNLVYNTEFYNTDRINNTYSPAVKIFGCGNIVRNCYFHDLKHQAIGFMGNDHLIEYCRFDHVCNNADDMGAIYTGRDPSSRGTIIQYNYFSNILPQNNEISMCGVYFDDGSGGMVIKNNFFYKVGNPGHYQNFGAIFCHGGSDNQVLNNIFMDCSVALGQSSWDDERWNKYLESPLIRERLKNNVDIMSSTYQIRYPELKDYFTNIGRRLNLVRDNLFIRTVGVQNGDFMLRKNITLDNAGDDPEKINYEEVTKFSSSTITFPFDKCGIKNIEGQ